VSKAFLEYAFIFDPVDTWQHLHQFEQDLAKFFDEHNLQAEVLDTVGGQKGRRVIVITPKEEIKIPPSVKKGKPKSASKRLKEMGKKKLRAPAKKWLNKKKGRKEKGFAKVMKKAGG